MYMGNRTDHKKVAIETQKEEGMTINLLPTLLGLSSPPNFHALSTPYPIHRCEPMYLKF